MERILYKGFEVILGDADTKKCKEWRELHWKCTVKDKLNRKQMSFDVFGNRLSIMKPLQALYHLVSDACYFMNVDDVKDVMDLTGFIEHFDIYETMEECQKAIG